MPALSPIKSAPVSRTRFVSFPPDHLMRGLSVLTLAVVLSACGKSEAPAAAPAADAAAAQAASAASDAAAAASAAASAASEAASAAAAAK